MARPKADYPPAADILALLDVVDNRIDIPKLHTFLCC